MIRVNKFYTFLKRFRYYYSNRGFIVWHYNISLIFLLYIQRAVRLRPPPEELTPPQLKDYALSASGSCVFSAWMAALTPPSPGRASRSI